MIEKIYDHCEEEGWLVPGATIVDSFGGIACGAWPAVSRNKGYRHISIELEEHFHNLGQGCDCTGITAADYVRFYGRWQRMRYAEGRYWCPRCLAQVAQVTGERRPAQRTFRTQPRPGRKSTQRTVAFLALPLPDRRDGWRPPRTQALFAPETASYARNSGVIPHTAAHHYQGNIEVWSAKGYTGATLLRGDSRNLCAIIQAHADLLVSSSPYAATAISTDLEGCNEEKLKRAKDQGSTASRATWGASKGVTGQYGYGTSTGQLSAMPNGSLDAALAGGAEAPPQADLAVSSSPYADGCTHTGGADPQPQHVQGGPLRWVQYGADCAVSSPPYANQHLAGDRTQIAHLLSAAARDGHGNPGRVAPGIGNGMGESPQNLGTMPPGDVAAVVQGDLGVASPPYEDSINGDTRPFGGIKASPRRSERQMGGYFYGDYGSANGQLGSAAPTTFWEAAFEIVFQTFQVLKPGAYAVWVTKHYIRDGALVDFPGDWRKLCEAVGFQTVHIHLAMLVERRVETHLFEGETTYEQWTESFFRRLSRKKTGLGIEFETVICQVKPLTAAPMPPDEAWQQLPLVAECSISSAPFHDSLAQNIHTINFDSITGNMHRKPGHLSPAEVHQSYGTSPAQLGAMKAGSLDLASGGINLSRQKGV